MISIRQAKEDSFLNSRQKDGIDSAQDPSRYNQIITRREMEKYYSEHTGSYHPAVSTIAELKIIPRSWLIDGVFCYVENDVEINNGLFRFDLQSLLPEAIPLVAAPNDGGVGRWLQITKGIATHNGLSEIQGGIPEERYHMDEDQHNSLSGASGLLPDDTNPLTDKNYVDSLPAPSHGDAAHTETYLKTLPSHGDDAHTETYLKTLPTHGNAAHSETFATETFVNNYVAQSLVGAFFFGFELQNTDLVNGKQISVLPGLCWDDTFTQLIKSTGTLVIDRSVQGANGRAEAIEVAATWYYVFVIKNNLGNVAGLVSTSLSPTLPSGYLLKRRVGIIKTSAVSRTLNFVQSGAGVSRTYLWLEEVNTTLRILTGGAQTLYTYVSAAVWVPIVSNLALFDLGSAGGAKDDLGYIRQGGSTLSYFNVVNGDRRIRALWCPVDSLQRVEYRVSAGAVSLFISVRGFVDNVS